MLICEDEILEELVLKLCRGDEVLSIRSNFWFQTYQVEIETLAVHDTLHYVCEIRLATTRKEDCEGIFLLDAQLDELNLQLYQYLERCHGRGILTIASFHQPFQA